jgi:hypothetical protein
VFIGLDERPERLHLTPAPPDPTIATCFMSRQVALCECLRLPGRRRGYVTRDLGRSAARRSASGARFCAPAIERPESLPQATVRRVSSGGQQWLESTDRLVDL